MTTYGFELRHYNRQGEVIKITTYVARDGRMLALTSTNS